MSTQYEQYKDSGIQWLGEIPQHWEVNKLKHLATVISSNVDKHIKEDEIKVFLCNYTDVYYNQVINSETQLSEGSCTENEFEKNQLKTDDVIITKDSEDPEDIGVPCLISENLDNTVCGYHLTMLRPSDLLGRYLFRFLQNDRARSYFALNAKGITRFALGKPAIQNIIVPLPPHSEQTAIANYLDEKTSQIDRLIDIARKKIERLQEYRTALINQLVTKGLDPNVPMKDSGIEWIGEIPEHWDVIPFKRTYNESVDYRGRTPEKVESGIFLVTAKNIKEGFIDYEVSQEFISEESFNKILERGQPEIGDLLLTMEAPLGNTALVDNEKIGLAQRIILFKIDQLSFLPKFILYWTRSNPFQSFLSSNATGSTALGLKASKISYLKALKCPIQEQHSIVNYLDKKTELIDNKIIKEENRIHKLQEYRQTLISEVVTGKKKVVKNEAYEPA